MRQTEKIAIACWVGLTTMFLLKGADSMADIMGVALVMVPVAIGVYMYIREVDGGE